jgi:hypothetical protein
MEIRRAIAKGIVKPEIDENAKNSKGINKFTAMFNKAAVTRARHTERIKTLLSTLQDETSKIIHNINKE